MRYDNTVIPLRAAWSSPFVRWQGPTADVNSLDLAEQVTARALAERGVDWPIVDLVLGWTIPQKDACYGAPTLASRLGFPGVSGPMVSQACATSVAAVHAAAASQQGYADGARLVVTTDRTSNGPHLVYPRTSGPGGTADSENWVLDSFERDPVTDESMLATAERVAAEGGWAKPELDELTVRRYEQYEDALADDRAFQRRWMVPITVGRGRHAADIDAIKTHNPFVVNDLWFARETDVDARAVNPYGCSLIYGHPQGPTGARGIVELIHALEERGGGRGLFTGCAAGDTGAALVVEVDA